MKKIFLKTLIITFIISAIFGISIILSDLWNDITIKILLSTSVMFEFSIPALLCSINYEKTNSKNFSITGIIFCFISCLYFLLLIWNIIDFNWKAAIFCTLISMSLGHICLLLLVKSTEKIVNYSKNITIVLSIIMDLCLSLIIFSEGDIDIDWKFLSTLAILIALGTIVTPLLYRLNKRTSSTAILQNNKYKRLEQIKCLLDKNVITQEKYDIEKKKILDSKD